MQMNFDIFASTFMPLLAAFGTTIALTIFGFAFGQILGLPVGIALSSNSTTAKTLARIYTFVWRGTPLLVQLLIIYYGLPRLTFLKGTVIWPFLIAPLVCATIGIALNSAAYTGALVGGGIQRVAAGQREAAQTLGFSKWQTLRYIILPQAYRSIFPAIGNEFILVMKASTLASAIAVMDVTGAARSIVAQTYAPFQVFAVAGLLYFVFGSIAGQVFRFLEARRLGPIGPGAASAS